MMKHTPGPWTAWNDDSTGTLPCVLSKNVTTFGNFYVAQCNVFDDARLIAAAPDMFAALQRIAEGAVMSTRNNWTHADTVVEYQKIASAAIAKVCNELAQIK